jgi:hypothetical protein
MATCRLTLCLLTVKEILLVHFIYYYKFSGCTQNVVYTLATKSFDDLEIAASAAKRPWRQFFSRFVKVRFRILDIQITISVE